ncbi:MAG: hypothetical protein U0074_25670, partial [Kouleothrix sp.]
QCRAVTMCSGNHRNCCGITGTRNIKLRVGGHAAFGWLKLQRRTPPGPRGLAQQLVRRLLAPVFAQQRAFNAAALKLVYTLSEPPEPSDTEHNQA